MTRRSLLPRTLLALVASVTLLAGCETDTPEASDVGPLPPSFESRQPELFSTFGAQANAWADYDGDGDLDLFVANQNGDEDGVFRNLGDGRFEDVAAILGMNHPGRSETQGSVGVAVSDYDNDGDFDNDGWLDLFVGTFLGAEAEAPDHLFRNVGGVFEDVTPAPFLEKGASHGVAWADYDIDGDLDLALANNHDPAGSHPLYENTLRPSRAGRSLQVAVVDDQGRWTREGDERRTTTVSGVDVARFRSQWLVVRVGTK